MVRNWRQQWRQQWRWGWMAGTIVLLVLTLASPAWAIPVQAVPNPRQDYGWVSDLANILPPSAEATLNRELAELESHNGTEMTVVTVPDTHPSETPKQFAIQLFKTWGIGKQHRNNGVLVLIAKDNRRIEIEIGTGIEPLLSKANIREIIQTRMAPYFRQNDFAGGTLAGVTTLIHQLDRPPQQGANPNHDRSSDFLQGFWLTLGLIVVGITGWFWDRLIPGLFPILLPPEGTSQADFVRNPSIDRAIKCLVCKAPMQPVEETAILAHLSQPQQISRQIGHIRVEGWQCPHCQPDPNRPFHLRTYLRTRDPLHQCPVCQELTAEQQTIVLEPATINQPGKRQVVHWCHYCPYCQTLEEPIPWEASVEDASMQNTYISHVDSGGSFGGGDSNGGGDGGSW